MPIGLVKEEVIAYELQRIYDPPEESVLTVFAQQYLLGLMQAGQILVADHAFSYEEQFCRLDSSFSCFEMIGITRPEEGIKKNE